MVTVTDANGCDKITSVTIMEDRVKPTVNIRDPFPLTCSRMTVTIDGSSSSAGPEFSYLWKTIGGNIVSGSTTPNVTVDAAGTYTLRVKNSNNGCTDSKDVEVKENKKEPRIKLIRPLVPLTCRDTLVIIDASESDQGPEFKYLWSTMNGKISGARDLPKLIVLASGSYKLEIYNEKTGCKAERDFVVMNDTVTPVARILTPLGTQLNCYYDTLDVTAEPQIFNPSNTVCRWFDPDGNIASNDCNYKVFPADSSHIGKYIFSVMDTSNGCFDRDCVVISYNKTIPPLEINHIRDRLSCTTKEIILWTDFKDGYNYEWQRDRNQTISHLPVCVAESAGITKSQVVYEIFVTDTSNGCVGKDSLLVLDFDPTPFVVEAEDAPAGSDTGYIRVVEYPEDIDAYLEFSIEGLEDHNKAIRIIGAEANDFRVPVGTYWVTITGIDRCRHSELIVVGRKEADLEVSFMPFWGTCLGGLDGYLEIFASGANPPLNVTVYQEGFDRPVLSIVQSTSKGRFTTDKVLPPGRYTVVVSDSELNYIIANSETDTSELVATIETSHLSVIYNQPMCHDDNGVAYASVTGQQNGGITFSSSAQYFVLPDGSIFFENLPVGTHWVIANDSSGCSDTAYFDILEPEEVTFDAHVVKDSMDGQYNIFLDIFTGVPPFRFQWANEQGVIPDEVLDKIRVPAGCYTVTVVDDNGCEHTKEIKIMSTSTKNGGNKNEIVIYPNPVLNSLHVIGINSQENIKMYDMSGRDMQVKLNNNHLDISHLSSGIYLLFVKTDDYQKVFKIVKE